MTDAIARLILKLEIRLKAIVQYLSNSSLNFFCICFIAFSIITYNHLSLAVTLPVVIIIIAILRTSLAIKRAILNLLLAVLAFSFALYRTNTITNQNSLIEAEFKSVLSSKVHFSGIIETDPIEDFDYTRVVIKLDSVNAKNLELPVRVIGSINKYPKVGVGDRCKVEGQLKLPEKFDDFDYRSFLLDQKIHYQFRASNYNCTPLAVGFKSLSLRQNVLAIKTSLYRFKKELSYNINRYLPEPHSSLLAGIIMGEKRYFLDEFNEALRMSGTTHIVAASGYNISLIISSVEKSFGWVKRRTRLSITLIAIWLFTLLSGMSVSILRAAVMASILILAKKFGALATTHSVLILMLFIFALINPGILNQISFQLSLLSVIGLYYMLPAMSGLLDRFVNRFRWLTKARPFVESYFLTTLCTMLATLPVIVITFKQLSLGGLIANILILPVIESAMFIGLGGLLFTHIIVLIGQAFYLVVWVQLKYFEIIVNLVARMEFLVLDFSGNAMLSYFIGIYCLSVITFVVAFYPVESSNNYYLKLFQQ